MAFELKMPKHGETMVEGTIVKWLKEEGEEIKEGELLYVMTTDKASLEVESPKEGILAKILVQANKKVKIGTPIAIILEPEETLEELEIEGIEAEREQPLSVPREGKTEKYLENRLEERRRKASPAAKHLADRKGIHLSFVEPKEEGRPILLNDVKGYLSKKQKATPVAKKMAESLSIDLNHIEGTGLDGMITKKDIEIFLETEEVEGLEQKAKREEIKVEKEEGIDKTFPLEGLRAIIADRMSLSYQQAPHVTLTTKTTMDRVISFRKKLLTVAETRISYTDFVVKIVATTLEKYPIMNSHFIEDRIYMKKEINIGLAVGIPEGLVVPVIRNANLWGLQDLAQMRLDLVRRAKEQRLTTEDLEMGTFTITNLGTYGIEIFTPIINPPETAILGVGTITEEPVAVKGQVMVKPVMWLSLSFDHRVVDGAPAAEFLLKIKEQLENPETLLL